MERATVPVRNGFVHFPCLSFGDAHNPNLALDEPLLATPQRRETKSAPPRLLRGGSVHIEGIPKRPSQARLFMQVALQTLNGVVGGVQAWRGGAFMGDQHAGRADYAAIVTFSSSFAAADAVKFINAHYFAFLQGKGSSAYYKIHGDQLVRAVSDTEGVIPTAVDMSLVVFVIGGGFVVGGRFWHNGPTVELVSEPYKLVKIRARPSRELPADEISQHQLHGAHRSLCKRYMFAPSDATLPPGIDRAMLLILCGEERGPTLEEVLSVQGMLPESCICDIAYHRSLAANLIDWCLVDGAPICMVQFSGTASPDGFVIAGCTTSHDQFIRWLKGFQGPWVLLNCCLAAGDVSFCRRLFSIGVEVVMGWEGEPPHEVAHDAAVYAWELVVLQDKSPPEAWDKLADDDYYAKYKPVTHRCPSWAKHLILSTRSNKKSNARDFNFLDKLNTRILLCLGVPTCSRAHVVVGVVLVCLACLADHLLCLHSGPGREQPEQIVCGWHYTLNLDRSSPWTAYLEVPPLVAAVHMTIDTPDNISVQVHKTQHCKPINSNLCCHQKFSEDSTHVNCNLHTSNRTTPLSLHFNQSGASLIKIKINCVPAHSNVTADRRFKHTATSSRPQIQHFEHFQCVQDHACWFAQVAEETHSLPWEVEFPGMIFSECRASCSRDTTCTGVEWHQTCKGSVCVFWRRGECNVSSISKSWHWDPGYWTCTKI